MAQKAELTRGVMTLQQTEQWHFLTDAPLHALRKPLVNFPGCTTASQCVGPIDVPNPAEAWQVTVAAKKKVYGPEGLVRPGGPDPLLSAGQSAASADLEAESGEAPSKKLRRTDDTIEPMTWHGTSDQAWDEILNIAGANNPLPKMVTELVATEDSLAFKCLQKKLPYLGICFSEYHRKLLRTRLAQRVFMSMMEDDSPFGSPESRSTLQKIWANTDTADGDPEESGDDEPKSKKKKVTKATGSAGSKVSLTRKKRQSAGKD